MDAFSQIILLIAVVSFFTFQWLFHSVSPWVSSRVSQGFLRLTPKQKIEWNSRTVSTFHALVVGLFCLYILLFDDAVNQDPVWGDPTLVKINVGITTGYLISDLLLIFYYWSSIGDKFFVIHHLAALYACYYVLVSALLSNSGTCRQGGKETTKGEQLYRWRCMKNSTKWAAEENISTHTLAPAISRHVCVMLITCKCMLFARLFKRRSVYLCRGRGSTENGNMASVLVARCKLMRSVVPRYFTK